MKPSERIKEIADQWAEDRGRLEPVDIDYVSAIADYLDEEHEKNKPCEHKDSYQVDGLVNDVYYNVCNDCGVLFLAK